ncbi:MAG: hypothetical protein KGQ93_00305 [Cyanobacteria bacterium REEB459]|nr:hypothetical protein [Cyanobacteria bacterium REEB459]
MLSKDGHFVKGRDQPRGHGKGLRSTQGRNQANHPLANLRQKALSSNTGSPDLASQPIPFLMFYYSLLNSTNIIFSTPMSRGLIFFATLWLNFFNTETFYEL